MTDSIVTTHIISLMQLSQSNLRDMLLKCCMDETPDVRESAFALICDLTKVSCIFFYSSIYFPLT